MKRRDFIFRSGMVAMSISAFGNISWNGKKYVATSPTTSDILGPFYRPGSPLRSNLVPDGSTAPIMELSGTIYGEDGLTPLPEVLIESWQCDENEKYDNQSDEYILRGSQKTDPNGKYTIRTIVPIPYKDPLVGWRPAHIHLRISSPNRQDLITQIYLKGDTYIESDPPANSVETENRILELTQNNSGENQVKFDIVLGESYTLDDSGFRKIVGLYQVAPGYMEFYQEGELLFMKLNGQILEACSYRGENTFVSGRNMCSVKFDLQTEGSVKADITLFDNWPGVEKFPMKLVGTKAFKY